MHATSLTRCCSEDAPQTLLPRTKTLQTTRHADPILKLKTQHRITECTSPATLHARVLDPFMLRNDRVVFVLMKPVQDVTLSHILLARSVTLNELCTFFCVGQC